MRLSKFSVAIATLLAVGCNAVDRPAMPGTQPSRVEPLKLNAKEYFETRGVNFLVFSNWYNGNFGDSKMSGVELIHHGVRTATNGDVRLNITPEQWDEIPEFVKRTVDPQTRTIEAFLRYAKYGFDYSVKVELKGSDLALTVNSPKPIPKALEGKLGFNFELLPSAYFEKSYAIDGSFATFANAPSGLKELNDKVAPTLLARGKRLVAAPEDATRRLSITSQSGTLELYDGRGKAQNGWFVVRGVLPAGKSGTLLEWKLDANSIPGWTRPPMIAHSQVGYHPQQRKLATIELDAKEVRLQSARLLRIREDGETEEALRGKPQYWGPYTRYEYLTFDFSSIQKPGLYAIEYAGVTTAPFRIAADVYRDAWHSTLDTFLPVQMDHMLVNDAYRVWHGAGHLDDALQAPVNHQHFDLYAQGPTTDTPYKPGEHIPGLDIGGWHDAGDYDIRTQSQYATVMHLVNAWESFAIARDTTSIDYAGRAVELRVGDSHPDLLQQVEHGTLALIAQHRAVGHAIPGIIVPDVSQYTHLGDALTMTDGLIHRSDLSPLEANGTHSGKFDDRWAFTSYSSALNYGSIAGLAAASRALTKHNSALATESLAAAQAAWKSESAQPPHPFHHGNTTGGTLEAEKFKAAVELLVATGEKQYANAVTELVSFLGSKNNFERLAIWAVRALPHLDVSYRASLLALTQKYQQKLVERSKDNPFGVPVTTRGWAGSGSVIAFGVRNYYLHKAFPKVVDKESVYRSLHYLFGNHPGSNLSLVSNVGTRSKKVAYGANRADFSAIPGGIVPGVLILKPDFPENKEDWPFLWGENEYVVTLGPSYIFLVNAVEALLKESN